MLSSNANRSSLSRKSSFPGSRLGTHCLGGSASVSSFHLWRFTLALFSALTMSVVCSNTYADEPAKRFLNRLREEGYFDQGLKYLEISAAKNRLPANMLADMPLEKVILLQESLRTVKTQQQREERIAAIEKGYREFLSAAPSHSRRSETQTKLGDLLLDRAQSALDESKKPENVVSSESWRSKSRQAYSEALELYNQVTEELKPILISMEGDKIKSLKLEGKDLNELKHLREQYQQDYRQSQILQAKTMEFIALTYESGSPELRKWLEKSEANFNAVVDKSMGAPQAGPRMLSLMYLAKVQSQLGKTDEARNSYIRVAENEGEGIFRTWRVQATAGIVRLDSSEKVAKYEAAIQRGDEALKTATPKERDEAEWIDLQLAVAEARLAWGKTLDEKKEDNKTRNNRKAARELLTAILKKKGPHQVKAKQSLGELGIETAEKTDEKLPVTKAWADTIKAARERLDRAESLESTPAAMRDRLQSIELYQRALRMFRNSDSREELLDAKFLLAYLHLKSEQYWEAIALSQELLVSGKGTDKALKCGGFALTGFGKIISELPPQRQLEFVSPLVRLVAQLNLVDPTSKEAQSAVDFLVKLDLIHKRYDEAVKHIALGKGNSSGGGASMLGQILWGEYQQATFEHRKNKTVETQEDLNQKAQAESLLRSTWDAMAADKTDKYMVTGVNALAGIYLMSDRVDEALKVIDSPTKGAIALANSVQDLEPSIKLEAYRLKIQAMVQAAGGGKLPLSTENVSPLVQKMKELSGADDSLLTNVLNNLAVKLQSKLESSQNMEEQSKLGTAFGVLIQQLIAVSSDVATLDSVGSSILSLAIKMQKDPNLATNVKPLMSIAEAAFSKISAKPANELVDAKKKPDELHLKLALAKSGSGKFEEAHALFAKSLATNPKNIRFQVEAARNLQAWANGKDVDLLRKAVFGAEPDAKRLNVIWGWAKINQQTASRVNDFKDIFFEAQLSLARALRSIALVEPTPEKKKQGLERASNKIRETYQFYPEFGSPEMRTSFEKLLREIQQDLGQPVAGLQEFSK